MLKIWERISSELAHSSNVFDLKVERRISPLTGKHVSTVVLESSDWVNVVALTADERVVLVRQYRFGTEEIGLEIPGGLVDPGETPLEAARRELREETGLEGVFPTGLGVDGTPPGLIGYEEHPAGSKGLHLNFAFVADVPTRNLTACDEYTAVRWVADPVPVECPLNVRQLVRLALAASRAP
jgi:8-oxo-dGTP pyrophosphatase MutT (NUDIX family)